jgi:hypothetical protein
MIYKAHYKKLIIEQLLPEHHKISGWTQMLRKSVQFLLVPPSYYCLTTQTPSDTKIVLEAIKLKKYKYH